MSAHRSKPAVASQRRDKSRDKARDKAMGHRLQRMRSQSHIESQEADPLAAFDRRDVSLDCGWGRLIFAQTFSDRFQLVEALGKEAE